MDPPGALLARRTRTISMCSSDARSEGPPGESLREMVKTLKCSGTAGRGRRAGLVVTPMLAQRAASEGPCLGDRCIFAVEPRASAIRLPGNFYRSERIKCATASV